MKKHLWYYTSFILGELIGLVLLFFFAYDKTLQLLVLFFMTGFYVFWALLHHYFHHDITAKIVIEYVLIGILGMVVVFFFLQ
ncbi:MAG TPA: hypothetical protein VE090_05120 [Methylomirabilota bacterium]|nr:hypothetical protein [Methylomirabilota bacterium]